MPLGLDSATLNVLVGAFVAMLSSAALNWNARWVNRDRFRRSVLHEVRHVADAVDELVDHGEGARADGGDDPLPVADIERASIVLQPTLLESDLAQVNKLTTPEIEAVYTFYESARLMNRQLERAVAGDAHDAERIRRAAREMLRHRDAVERTIRRSRLSLLTERYKETDRSIRSGPSR